MHPVHATRRWSLVVLVLLAALVGPIAETAGAAPGPLAAPRPIAATPASAACIDAEERALLDGLNAYRAAAGKAPVALSQTLAGAADHHSLDMGATGTYAHTLSDGTTWQQNIANHGYAYTYRTYTGENLAAGIASASAALDLWKGSSTHNANLLNRHFKAVGIGRLYVKGSAYGWYWTLTFGGIADGAATACGATATAAAPSPSPSPSGGTTYQIVGSTRTANSSSSALAYDGKTTTAWGTTSSSAPSSAYVYFDLGATKPIRSIAWLWAESGWADHVRIQVSTDRSSWTTLATVGNAAAGSWQSLSYSGSARYVRFYFTNPNRDAKLGSLAEVRFGG